MSTTMTTNELRELLNRLDAAAAKLTTMATESDMSERESHRLHGKAEGVRLARSYVDELRRAGAA